VPSVAASQPAPSLIGWLDPLGRWHRPPGLCGQHTRRQRPDQPKQPGRAHNPAVHL